MMVMAEEREAPTALIFSCPCAFAVDERRVAWTARGVRVARPAPGVLAFTCGYTFMGASLVLPFFGQRRFSYITTIKEGEPQEHAVDLRAVSRVEVDNATSVLVADGAQMPALRTLRLGVMARYAGQRATHEADAPIEIRIGPVH